MGSRTAQVLRAAGALTLCQLETCFADWIPSPLFPKATAKQNSRDRDYTPARTFWCMPGGTAIGGAPDSFLQSIHEGQAIDLKSRR